MSFSPAPTATPASAPAIVITPPQLPSVAAGSNHRGGGTVVVSSPDAQTTALGAAIGVGTMAAVATVASLITGWALLKRRSRVHKYQVPGIMTLPQFSAATVSNGIIFVSGMLGTVGTSGLATGSVAADADRQAQHLANIRAETQQALANIKTTLEHVTGVSAASVAAKTSRSPLNRITKVVVYLKDDSKEAFDAMNAVYTEFFSQHSTCLSDSKVGMPARMTAKSVSLALGAEVEIECFAAL